MYLGTVDRTDFDRAALLLAAAAATPPGVDFSEETRRLLLAAPADLTRTHLAVALIVARQAADQKQGGCFSRVWPDELQRLASVDLTVEDFVRAQAILRAFPATGLRAGQAVPEVVVDLIRAGALADRHWHALLATLRLAVHALPELTGPESIAALRAYARGE
ncbi:hypothetical protein [Kineococcus terrestris]|uniref:hypothetical protein n=1 Tax=Kineococcus terrestris TaxID=2044856 RepID=UPI0034DB1767